MIFHLKFQNNSGSHTADQGRLLKKELWELERRRRERIEAPIGQARREGEGKGGKFSRAPRRLGAPPSLKNTENGVPDGFFLT